MDYSFQNQHHTSPFFLLILTLFIFCNSLTLTWSNVKTWKSSFIFKIGFPVLWYFILQKQGLCLFAFTQHICIQSLLCIETGCLGGQEKWKMSLEAGKGEWQTLWGQTVRFKICLHQWYIWASYLAFQFCFSCVQLFATPWITARQASLSITNSKSSLRLTSIESVMPCSHLILSRPLLLLPPIPPSIRVFSSESTLCMMWPKYWREFQL